MRTHHGLYYDSRIKLLLILLTSALAFALGGGLTGLLLFGVVCLFSFLSGLWKTSIKFLTAYSLTYAGTNPSNPFIFCDNFLLIKDFNHCTRFEHLISDYGNSGIDSLASSEPYPPGHCDSNSYYFAVSPISKTGCDLYKAGNENEGCGIIFLASVKSSSADIRRLFNSYTYATFDDSN